MKATTIAFVCVGFFKLHINTMQQIPDATIAMKVSTCVSNMKAENVEYVLFLIENFFLFIDGVTKKQHGFTTWRFPYFKMVIREQ